MRELEKDQYYKRDKRDRGNDKRRGMENVRYRERERKRKRKKEREREK